MIKIREERESERRTGDLLSSLCIRNMLIYQTIMNHSFLVKCHLTRRMATDRKVSYE